MAARLFALLLVSTCCVCYGWEGYITMRDGTKLHTAVDFPVLSASMGETQPELALAAIASGLPAPRRSEPEADKKYTLVMDRSPYGQFGTELLADIYLLLGYVAVRQDMRGTHLSQGNFTVWHNAANDAYDTMKALTNQSWSDGTVYTIGASADGIASFCEPLDQPKWLKKQFIIWATSRGREVMFPGGAYRMALIDFWLDKTVPSQSKALIHEVQENEGPGPWWNPINDTGQYYKVNFPSVMWAGWYDIFLLGNLAGFDGYQHQSSLRGQSKLVVDPLGHCQDGHKYFPHNLIEGRVILPILLSWDLYKNYSAAEGVKDVTFYVMGSYGEDHAPGNYWTTLDTWPKFSPMDYYLHADGSLQTVPPAETLANHTYTYDPANPVPTLGGNNLELKCGPLDQRELETRADVLTFTTPTLSSHVAVTGPLIATLFVSSSAKDTDFTVKLTDVYPDGTSRLIQDGIARMRWRNGGSVPHEMKPGQVYQIEVGMWNTSFVFNQGHKIRIAVSSSNAPRFNPNPNTGLPLVKNGTVPAVVAHNTLHHSSTYPSKLVLPTVSLDQLPPHFVLDQELALLRSVLGTDEAGAARAHKAISARVIKSVLPPP